MKKQPLISIIVNCFNGETYLKDCLNSILSQSYENYEVIFWDNKSKDKSKKIFLKFKDLRFKYFTDYKHVSLYSARNKALNLARGEYICFLDVDDKWLPEKLKSQVNIMISNPKIGFCYSGFKFLSEESMKLKSAYNNNNLKSGFITASLLKNYNVGLLTLMLNKKIIDSNTITFDKRFNIMGDLDFVLRLSKVSLGVPIKSDLAIYRNHKSNLSSNIFLTVQERKIWQNEMLFSKLFKNSELVPFINETKYLDFRNEINNYKFIKSFKKLFSLKGLFFIKAIIILSFSLVNSISKKIKNKNKKYYNLKK